MPLEKKNVCVLGRVWGRGGGVFGLLSMKFYNKPWHIMLKKLSIMLYKNHTIMFARPSYFGRCIESISFLPKCD